MSLLICIEIHLIRVVLQMIHQSLARPRKIQCTSDCNNVDNNYCTIIAISVRYLSVCLSVPSWKPRFRVDWRLLVEELILQHKKTGFREGFEIFLVLNIFWVLCIYKADYCA